MPEMLVGNPSVAGRGEGFRPEWRRGPVKVAKGVCIP